MQREAGVILVMVEDSPGLCWGFRNRPTSLNISGFQFWRDRCGLIKESSGTKMTAMTSVAMKKLKLVGAADPRGRSGSCLSRETSAQAALRQREPAEIRRSGTHSARKLRLPASVVTAMTGTTGRTSHTAELAHVFMKKMLMFPGKR